MLTVIDYAFSHHILLCSLTALLINEHCAATVTSGVMDDVARSLNLGWVRRREISCSAGRHAQR